MVHKKKNDVIDDLLSGKNDPAAASGVEELDCLIYRSLSDISAGDLAAKTWEETRDNVTIQVWEEKAKICVKMPPDTRAAVSMKKIADIALNAILKELKKEEES